MYLKDKFIKSKNIMSINLLYSGMKSYFRKLSSFARRIFLLTIILCLSVVFLSACQSPAKKSGVTHITLWQGINPPINRDVFQKLVAQFNQTHPDIQVESIFAGAVEQQLPKVLTAVVGNVPPDLLVFYPQMTGKLVELGAIQPLDDWLDKLPLKSEIFPNILDELKINGHLWSAPFYTSNIGIFYRPKLFEAAGITQLPKTWEELQQVAKKLTIDRNGDKRPEQYGILLPLGKEEWTVVTWFPFLLSAGGNVLTNNQPNLANPAAISALQFWQNLLKDGSATLSLPERGYEEDAFLTGRVAMQITGPWSYITKSNVDYAAMPIPNNVKPATVTGTGNIYLMNTTPQKKQASLKFLEYVMSADFQKEWAMGTNFLPINNQVAQDEEYQQYLNQKPWLKVFQEQIHVASYRPVINGYSRLSESLGRAIEAALLGQSPEKALKEAQERLELFWINN
jgi:multiple sugar transport system substrate-binding protein